LKTYTYHTDNGHGWLQVPYADFRLAGLTTDQVKDYSYATVEGDTYIPTMYLEEDCHMSMFLDALAAKGIDFNIVEKHHTGDAYIRELGRVS